MKPFSYLLTFLTISACSSTEQLWCMTPNPPSSAICIAIECSVTVSIGEERSGVLREIRFVTGESRETSDAAKPVTDQPFGQGQERRCLYTNESWKHEDIIVCQSPILGRVQERVDVESVSRLELGLQHMFRFGVV
jgi:hypothetical protein